MMLAQRGISPLVTLASYPDLKVQIFPSLSQVVWSNIQNVGKNDVIRLRIETEMESVWESGYPKYYIKQWLIFLCRVN